MTSAEISSLGPERQGLKDPISGKQRSLPKPDLRGGNSVSTTTTKPYEFIGFGGGGGQNPYEFTGILITTTTEPYEFIYGFGVVY